MNARATHTPGLHMLGTDTRDWARRLGIVAATPSKKGLCNVCCASASVVSVPLARVMVPDELPFLGRSAEVALGS
jgi:hypothetical protein